MQQGALGEAKGTAINFLSMGLAVDEVAKGTGLEKSVIEELKKGAHSHFVGSYAASCNPPL